MLFRSHNKHELENGVKKAFNNTSSDYILLEKYMECDDMFLNYTFRNGEIIVSATGDRYTCRVPGDLGKVCIGAVYPSKYTELYFKDLHPKMVSLFNDLGVKNGTLTISAFVEDSNIHLYDPGYRLQGEAQNIHIEELCGYDQKTMLIEFALGGSMGKVNLYDLIDYNFNGKHAATLWLLSKAGQIGSIEGLEEVSTKIGRAHV